ncbi:MAG: hypothetical protein KJ914_01880 [Gammaproteobacteria bacterium]|nr:hypothetical protein [Gammaproteobacteria bacterium]MBU1724731.1 hypothetical protein [Gammaproteobacteria bacterium]MBU2005902.1 hypothetical protein [Gammaproteobacteria bacterium]
MNIKRHALRSLLLLFPLVFASVTVADDAEIYYSQTASANPNILFVLDNSGSMQMNEVPGSGGQTRMQVMQEVFSSVMATAPSNLNVGLMRYGGHTANNASGVSFPAKPIDLAEDGTGDALSVLLSGGIAINKDNLPDPASGTPVRKFLSDVGNNWTALGYTPIVDALYEAALYYRGEGVDFGNLTPSNVRAAHPSTYQNKATSICQVTSCNNTAGQCTGTVVAGSCSAQWNTVCTKSETQTVTTTLTNQCCGWETVDQPGACCQWETVQQSGQCCGWVKDEAGKDTNVCANNDYSCSKDVQQCKNNDYSCTSPVSQCKNDDYSCTRDVTETRTVCVEEAEIQTEYCQHETCSDKTTRQYISPIEYECQTNYIVLMSDGHPEYSTNRYPLRKNAIESLTNTGKNCGNNAPNSYKSGTCGPELTKFLASTDQNAALEGDQLVNTFTVAFGVDNASATEYLSSLANVSGGALAARDEDSLRVAFRQIIDKVNAGTLAMVASATPTYRLQDHTIAAPALARNEGRGLFRQTFGLLGDSIKYVEVRSLLMDVFSPMPYLRQFAATGNGAFTAGNLQELTDAFTNILDRIDASASSFSSPAYNVDKDSMLAHSDEVYIPVFERNMLPLWSGNLKKFKLKDGVIVGQDDQPAVDEQGVFTDAAWDLWSASASGKNVAAGGAASQLPAPALRRLYTDTSGLALSELDVHNATLTIDDLYEDHDGNDQHGDNPGGCDPDNPAAGSEASCVSYRSDLINFVRGVGKDGQPRQHMGDVMNNKPLVVDYTSNGYVLVGSNEGFLHAFDSGTGIEKWAFMPEMLLKNAAVYYDNTKAKQHVYGIDGAFTSWFRDKNANGKVDKADGDKFYLYFGMRRGGRAYYALDISDIDSPKVLWKITSADTGFSELGESWSKPAMAKMRLQPDPNQPAELKDVLVFGGGFDPALEEADPAQRAADVMGRDVFIVDAETGKLLWSLRGDVSGAATSLPNSIPGDIRVLDMDRNGALDRLYFSDTGGKVWRVDMDMDVRDTDTSLYSYADAKLTLFADLAGTGLDSRKFYYEPDVALMQNNGQTVMTVSIGSGYRSHPQNADIQDRFYVMLDENVYAPPADSWVPLEDTALTEADTLAATGNDLLDGSSHGWYIELPNKGEKVLASAVTFLNKVIFTTFANDGEVGSDPCSVPPNSARAYVVNLFNGQAVADLDRSGDGVREKSVIAGINEILGSAQVIFHTLTAADGSSCTETDCGQSVEIRVGKMQVPVMDSGNSQNGNGNAAESTDLGSILPRIFWRDNKVSQ